MDLDDYEEVQRLYEDPEEQVQLPEYVPLTQKSMNSGYPDIPRIEWVRPSNEERWDKVKQKQRDEWLNE